MSHTIPKAGVNRSRGTLQVGTVEVCVLAEHVLVKKYLIELLHNDSVFKIVDVASLTAHDKKSIDRVVFVFDRKHLELPLSTLLKQLRACCPNNAWVMIDAGLSAENRGWLVSAAIEGFVTYAEVDDSLINAIRTVAEGRAWLPSSVLQESASRLCAHGARLSHVSSLTPRELEVLDMLKRRLTNKEIAQTLSLGETTIRFHVSNILLKLNANSRHDLSPTKTVESCPERTPHPDGPVGHESVSNTSADTLAIPPSRNPEIRSSVVAKR